VEVEQIKNVVIEYYRRLLGSTTHEFDVAKASIVTSLLVKRICEDQFRCLEKEVSE
jgi:hypothetical protein